jgi:biopolymer transport protein ExbD
VDVKLVLLIIFMSKAPMMYEGMEVKMPQVDAGAMPRRRAGGIHPQKPGRGVFRDEVQDLHGRPVLKV